MEHISPYIRQFTIQVLCITFVVSCIMTINIYGNYEIFPIDTKENTTTYEGVEITYRQLQSRSYFDKITLKSGIPYLIFFIFFIGAYISLSCANLDK
jgi:hypothetical protein